MDLSGQRSLPLDRAAIWRALNDPEVLKASVSGCDSFEKTADGEYAVVVTAALGPVRARFRGKLRLADVQAPESYTLRFEGDGGVAGFARGDARVRLEEAAGTTTLHYEVKAHVGGRLAQVGNRLIDSAALKLADDFFAAFERQVAPPSAQAAPAPARPDRRLSRVLIAAAIAAVVAAIAYGLR